MRINSRRLSFWLVCGLPLVLAGCPDIWGPQPNVHFFVGATGEKAYVKYYKEYSGFEALPSVVYQVSLSGGEAKALHDARIQYAVQISGDYLVAERPAANNTRSQIFATKISTNEEFVILEREEMLGGQYHLDFAADGARVIALTDTGVLVYDLIQRKAIKEIVINEPLIELSAGGDWALASTNPYEPRTTFVINLNTDSVELLPDVPDGYRPSVFSPVFNGETLYTSAVLYAGSLRDSYRVLSLYLPTLAWNTVAQYDPDPSPHVFGASEDDVFVQRTFDMPFQTRIESIQVDSKASTILLEEPGDGFGFPIHPRYRDGRIYWITTSDELVVFDVATQTRQSAPLAISP